MGTKSSVDISDRDHDDQINYDTKCICYVCSNKLALLSNDHRCMNCGNIACSLCLKTSMNEQDNSYFVICNVCIQKEVNRKEAMGIFDEMDETLKNIVENHKDNGRELLIYGYIRVLWISHCLIYGNNYNSRFPSNDVIQCIISWLFINESFDKNWTMNKYPNLIKFTNCNQCIQRVSNENVDVCHIYGTTKINMGMTKIWKFKVIEMENDKPNFIIGIVKQNKINEIGTFLGRKFNDSFEYGFGLNFNDIFNFDIKINDIIIMTFNQTIEGRLKYCIYRNQKCITNGWNFRNAMNKSGLNKIYCKETCKLAIAMTGKDKISLVEEWWNESLS